MNNTLSINSNNSNVSFEPKPLGLFEFTDVKVKKVALYTLSTLFFVGSALAVGAFAAPLAFIAIPLVGAGLGLLYWANTFKDYDDPVAVYKMQQRALTEPFSQIFLEHGFDKIKKYQILPKNILQEKFMEEYQYINFSNLLQKYPLRLLRTEDLISLEALQGKFAREIQRMNVSEFLNTFSVPELSLYQIVSEKQLLALDALLKSAKDCNKNLDLSKRDLDARYPTRLSRLLRDLDREASDVKMKALRLKQEIAQEIRYRPPVGYPFKPHDSWNEYHRKLNEQYIEQEFSTIPAAQKAIDLELDRDLNVIRVKKEFALNDSKAKAEQVKYEEELNRLEKSNSIKLESLNVKFIPIRESILKEAKL